MDDIRKLTSDDTLADFVDIYNSNLDKLVNLVESFGVNRIVETFISEDNQTDFKLLRGSFAKYTNSLQVFAGGSIQVEIEDYIEISHNTIRFLEPLPRDIQVVIIYTDAPTSVKSDITYDYSELYNKVTELNRSLNSLKEYVGNTNDTVKQLSTTVGNTNDTVKQLSTTVGNTNDTVKQLSTTVGNTNDTVKQLSTTVGNTNDTVKQLSTTVGNTNEAVEGLKTTVGNTNEAVEGLKTTVGNTNEAVEGLKTKVASLTKSMCILEMSADQEKPESGVVTLNFDRVVLDTNSEFSTESNKFVASRDQVLMIELSMKVKFPTMTYCEVSVNGKCVNSSSEQNEWGAVKRINTIVNMYKGDSLELKINTDQPVSIFSSNYTTYAYIIGM